MLRTAQSDPAIRSSAEIYSWCSERCVVGIARIRLRLRNILLPCLCPCHFYTCLCPMSICTCLCRWKICLYTFMFICLHMSIRMSIHMSMHMSMPISRHVSARNSTKFHVQVSTNVSTHVQVQVSYFTRSNKCGTSLRTRATWASSRHIRNSCHQ